MSYETDIAAWAEAQVDALRRRSVNELDWEHLIEEIEAVGISQRSEIESRLMRICEHLLKLAYLPDLEPRRLWRVTVIEQRRRLARLLQRNPSLRGYPATVLADAYDDARALVAEDEPHLPEICPWTVEQVLNEEFYA